MIQGQRAFSVNVESWSVSLQGGNHAENQDAFLNWADHRLWAVADGMGGGLDGAGASKAVVKFLTKVPAPDSLDRHIRNVTRQLENANDFLQTAGRAAGGVSASTALVLLLNAGSAACLWAGDSRCYIFRDGVLYQCTKDHTLRQEKIDSGELTALEAGRMISDKIITNAVGVHDALRLSEVRFPLRAGDKFLLCSDGLSHLVETKALPVYMARPTAKEAVESMVETLDERRLPDDVTLMTVFLSEQV
ncbi:MAG: serine/threonine-protein phosphatase [Desulfovibrio sp.]|jgi:serine/threonine-protein phosphatase Stp1|nr:serine/threonine-protein phosphatase [Desulfovibrio sp.]